MNLEMDCSFEVINPTGEPVKYPHAVQCEIVEKPSPGLMTLVSSQENYSFVPPITVKSDDPNVREMKGPDVTILPAVKGVSYRFGSKFSMIYPEEFFYAIHVGVPTIGMIVEVIAPEDYEVTASPTPTSAQNVWRYEKLFMPGEHIDIRWQRKFSN
jgi:hypothetical protein